LTRNKKDDKIKWKKFLDKKGGGIDDIKIFS